MDLLPDLMLFHNDDDIVWVPGPKQDTRSDGTSLLITSQAYGSTKEYPIGTMLTDSDGGKWRATHPIRDGFFIEGIILEAEEFYGAQ